MRTRLAAVTVAALLLAACGGDAATDEEATNAAEVDETAESTAPADDENGGDDADGGDDGGEDSDGSEIQPAVADLGVPLPEGYEIANSFRVEDSFEDDGGDAWNNSTVFVWSADVGAEVKDAVLSTLESDGWTFVNRNENVPGADWAMLARAEKDDLAVSLFLRPDGDGTELALTVREPR